MLLRRVILSQGRNHRKTQPIAQSSVGDSGENYLKFIGGYYYNIPFQESAEK